MISRPSAARTTVRRLVRVDDSRRKTLCSRHRLDALGGSAELPQRGSTAFMDRVYCERPPKVCDGLLAASLRLVEVTPVAISYRVVRIDPYGLTVVGNGAVVIPLALHSAASVVVGYGEIRVDLDGLIEVGDSAVVVLLIGI